MKRSLIFTIIGILALIGGLGAGLLLVGQRQLFQQKAAPASTMYISPSSLSQAPGSNFTFTVKMDTGTNAVTGVDVQIAFNPGVVQINSLTKGSGIVNLDTKIQNTFDNTAGSINFSYATLDGTKAVTGSGLEVLVISATVKASATSGSYTLAFGPDTSAAATAEGQNVLVSKTGASLAVTGATTNPTTNPTNSPTPTSTIAPLVTQSSVTASPTPTSSSISSSTSSPVPIPVTGIEWPTLGAAAVGIIVIAGSILLAI